MSHRRRSSTLLPLTMSIKMPASRSTSPVAHRGEVRPVGLQPRRLVHPQLGHQVHPAPIFHQRDAVIDHRPHHRPPAHPQLLRQLRHRPSVLTHLPARLRPARRLSSTREMCGEVSVQVLASQSASTHRQRRFRQTSRAGRPKQGRSRMATSIRLRLGPRPATGGRRPIGRRLDLDHELVGRLAHRQNPEPGVPATPRPAHYRRARYG